MNASTEVLTAGMRRILRPLAKLLLRNGVSFHAASDLLKELYVDVARTDFVITGRKQSVSRISTLTGLTRKEVSRALSADPIDLGAVNQQYNRAVRVVTGWSQDSRYIDVDGEPQILPFEGPLSFSSLVREFSGDIPPRAIADELIRVSAVSRTDDGLRLMQRAYIPAADVDEKLRILGTDVADLVRTIDHNIYADAKPHFQRKVMYDAIVKERLEPAREELQEIGQRALEQMDDRLQAHSANAPSDTQRTFRAGVGIYYFEEENEPS